MLGVSRPCARWYGLLLVVSRGELMRTHHETGRSAWPRRQRSVAVVVRVDVLAARVSVAVRLRSARTSRVLLKLADLRAVAPRLRGERALQTHVAGRQHALRHPLECLARDVLVRARQ